MSDGTIDVHALAKLLNLDIRRIQQLAAEGHVFKAERGRYHLARSINGYCKFMQKANGGSDQDPNSFSTQRTRLTRARADLIEMEREERSGMLIPADQVEEAWIKITSVIRARMLAMPAKLAPRMAAAKSSAEAREILDGEFTNALVEIAETPVVVIPDDGASDHGAGRNRDVSVGNAAT